MAILDTPDDDSSLSFELSSFKKVRNSVILPDGTKSEPMGSGMITGLIGVGGMANVYEIWNPQLEINRAVKLLHPNYTEETKQRFQTEIKITAKLHHANIIEIHGVGTWNNLPYIEMERIYGQTLEKLVTDRGALPVEVCTSIAIMIGRALRYAHNQDYVIYGKNYHGVIHRDLKPSNVMVSVKGVVKLMDFGIARPTDASIHTTDGSILGTMQYLSPEQLDGKEPDIRTDIYSLGAVLYEMITGVKAFPDHNVSRLMLSKIKNDYRTLDHYDVKIPYKLRKIVHQCLLHDRNKRIQDAAEFLSELSRVHKSITELPPEMVLAKFMGSATIERKVVSIRKLIPYKLILSVLAIIGVSYGLYNYRQQLMALMQKRNSSVSSVPLVKVEHDTIIILKSEASESSANLTYNNIYNKLNKPVQNQKKDGIKEINVFDKPSISSEITFLEKIKIKYGDLGLAEIFVKLVDEHNYTDALNVYSLIPTSEVNNKIMIYHIRALRLSGKNKELYDVLKARDVNDSEFYLEKSKLYVVDGDYEKALVFLEKCALSTASFSDGKMVRLERLYQTANCKSRIFDKNPNNTTKSDALDSWFEIKSELQTSKDHNYYRAAESEMQRITAKMNTLQG
jgi:serine/threonine protein kinase